MEQEFEAKYNIPFSEMEKVKFRGGARTRDGCDHYYHRKTDHIYSWNFLENYWCEMSNQKQLKNMME